MSIPQTVPNIYIPIKSFFASYRCLSDGVRGISILENNINNEKYLISDWKLYWIGTCATLRASVYLFKNDSKFCYDKNLAREFDNEFSNIIKHKDDHKIFWKFIRNERDNTTHNYEFGAYEAWIDENGTICKTQPTLLGMNPEKMKNTLIINSGPYKGEDSIDLLKKSADWIQDRIFCAIKRAGYDPEEKRGILDFSIYDKNKIKTLLADLSSDTSSI